MSELKTIGIVIRHADYRDSDRILTLLTQRGLVTATSRGCRRPGSPLLGASEMFVYGEFVLFENKNRFSLRSCDVRETFYPLREDAARLCAATYMANLVEAASTEQEAAAAQLNLLYYSLSYTAYTELSPLDMALCFALRYLSLIGFSPALTRCAVCGRDLRTCTELVFDPAAGGAACPECGRGEAISPLSLEAARRMLLLPDEDMKLVKLPDIVRRELAPAVNGYAERMLERRFKALSMLFGF